MNIGLTIKALRIGRKLTQQAAADRAGMNRTVWADLEHNRCSPTVATLERVAIGLGMDLAEIFRRSRKIGARL